jgi:4-hydroxy-tetrahydrodipicolinate synthase
MRKGFYTALGTPLDENGDLIKQSFQRQIEDQIDAGASGLLVMGSMGMQCAVKNRQYSEVAKTAVQSAKGKCPVLVGVMDNSVARVMDRIDGLKDLSIDGVVSTTPFYYPEKQDAIINFFTEIADKSEFPLYMYDLPPVTQSPITLSIVTRLMNHFNVKGIKSGNIVLAREYSRVPEKPEDFAFIFSGLDVFDTAYKYGIQYNEAKDIPHLYRWRVPI